VPTGLGYDAVYSRLFSEDMGHKAVLKKCLINIETIKT
jgi:hypothetical protein